MLNMIILSLISGRKHLLFVYVYVSVYVPREVREALAP